MKKILVFLILIVLLSNSMGYYILFELNRLLIQREMEARRGSDDTKLTRLVIRDPDRNRDFRRTGRSEFLFHGKMYDLVSEVKSGENTIFFCHPDHKEDRLISDFRNSEAKKLGQMLLDHLLKAALCQPVVSADEMIFSDIEYPNLAARLTRITIPPALPPPRQS